MIEFKQGRRTNMKRMITCLTVCALVLWGALAGAGENPKPEEQVKIDNFNFIPATLTVKAGTTVTWVNADDVPHTVVNTAKIFSSPVMDTDDKYTHKFTDPGSYEYYCSVHPHMKGKIIVQ
jgi:Icc protein